MPPRFEKPGASSIWIVHPSVRTSVPFTLKVQYLKLSLLDARLKKVKMVKKIELVLKVHLRVTHTSLTYHAPGCGARSISRTLVSLYKTCKICWGPGASVFHKHILFLTRIWHTTGMLSLPLLFEFGINGIVYVNNLASLSSAVSCFCDACLANHLG